jgi:chemotaxis protein CheX
MAPTQPITDTLIQDSIVKAVQNVSRTMLRQDATLVNATLADAANNSLTSLGAAPYIIGNVGFAGDANGLVYLCFTDEFARYAAGHILGMSAGEIEMHGYEVVKDVIGEITNMTTGGFKNALADYGFPCKLSLPTIVRGDRLSIAAIKSATRGIFHFTCGAHRLMADVQVKI